MAPGGRFAADRFSGKPPGSVAEKVKASGFPNAASSVPGRLSTGAVAGITTTELVTVVWSNCTEITDGCCSAKGVVKTSKLSCACAGRVVNGLGSSSFGLSLVTARRATCRIFGLFMPIVHVKKPPAWTVCGVQETLVGRMPVMERLAVVKAPCTEAVICACASWSDEMTEATN